ncbi:ABC transporter ATP-binding protein [Barrientosiimonas marina]|uniref:ATP-binding cassette domain-containing protein n=1 Tax=Lentibacillus kimchii TaxID=1542911 RepID=A0ABW2UW80_9BACI
MDKIKIENLTKYFGGRKVLDNINLDIPGSLGLLGPNGAGKTTLMRILTTLVHSDEGQIKYGEISWENKDNVRQLIGYLPQHFSMYQNLNILDVLDHFAVLKGRENKDSRNEEVQQVLQQVNLEQNQKTKIKHLSGGMLRRVGIAQALLGDPEILVIDEPTAGLDVEERSRFRRLLRSLSENRIIIISSHIVEDLETTCDHIGIIKNGSVVSSGTRDEVIQVASGCVFESELSQKQLDSLDDDAIISIKQMGDHYSVRYFDFRNQRACTSDWPTLEDAYLYRMRYENNETI